MWIGLTGTPGTGKTATADWLRAHGIQVVDLFSFATTHNCLCGEDPTRHTKLIDIDCLNTAIITTYTPDQTLLFEGHFAHLLPLDKVIILRCHPTTLRRRLQEKNYEPAKIQENVDAETLDVILCEAADLHPEDHCYEIDTTTRTTEETGTIIQTLITAKFPRETNYKIGAIDWSEEILKK